MKIKWMKRDMQRTKRSLCSCVKGSLQNCIISALLTFFTSQVKAVAVAYVYFKLPTAKYTLAALQTPP